MMKILIVEDNFYMRTKIKDILTKEGYTVLEARNTREMLGAYTKNSPDLVIANSNRYKSR